MSGSPFGGYDPAPDLQRGVALGAVVYPFNTATGTVSDDSMFKVEVRLRADWGNRWYISRGEHDLLGSDGYWTNKWHDGPPWPEGLALYTDFEYAIQVASRAAQTMSEDLGAGRPWSGYPAPACSPLGVTILEGPDK